MQKIEYFKEYCIFEFVAISPKDSLKIFLSEAYSYIDLYTDNINNMV